MSPKESREEMLRMQQDAVRRVREMQERARRTLEQSQAGTARSPSTEPKPRQEAPSPKPAQPNGPRTGRSFVAQPLKRAQEHHAPKGESPHPRPFPPNVPWAFLSLPRPGNTAGYRRDPQGVGNGRGPAAAVGAGVSPHVGGRRPDAHFGRGVHHAVGIAFSPYRPRRAAPRIPASFPREAQPIRGRVLLRQKALSRAYRRSGART